MSTVEGYTSVPPPGAKSKNSELRIAVRSLVDRSLSHCIAETELHESHSFYTLIRWRGAKSSFADRKQILCSTVPLLWKMDVSPRQFFVTNQGLSAAQPRVPARQRSATSEEPLANFHRTIVKLSPTTPQLPLKSEQAMANCY